MTDQSLQFPRFFITASSPCPYLDDREERKIFTQLTGPDSVALNDALSQVGFRRSQSVAYRPACLDCNACVSVRVLAQEFRISRSQKRNLKINDDVVGMACEPWVTDEQYSLLAKYLETRHSDGGMAGMDIYDFSEMVENTPVDTCIIEYRLRTPLGEDPGPLIGASLTDCMADGLSMVYSFFDPEEERRSLGTYMILDHIKRAAKAHLHHLYLGYWVEDCGKMAYKARFQPLEKLGNESWGPFDPNNA